MSLNELLGVRYRGAGRALAWRGWCSQPLSRSLAQRRSQPRAPRGCGARLAALASVWAAVLLGPALTRGGTAHALDVTACGQTVPAGQRGVLVADLTCPSGTGVSVAARATLDLAGHAIAAGSAPAIECLGHGCTITSSGGPGEVSGTALVDCIVTAPRARLRIDNLHVHDCRTCVETNPEYESGRGALAIASHLAVDHCAEVGINVRALHADHVAVTAAGGWIALWAEELLEGNDITASDNAQTGMFAGRRLRVRNLWASNNGRYGVSSFGLVSIRGGEIRDNASWDLVARRARLVGVNCGRSIQSAQALTDTLGVCADD